MRRIKGSAFKEGVLGGDETVTWDKDKVWCGKDKDTDECMRTGGGVKDTTTVLRAYGRG